MKVLSLLTQDVDSVRDITELITLFPGWELKHYDNLETAWISFFRHQPDLSVVDLDMLVNYKSNPEWKNRVSQKAPLVVFISSLPNIPEEKRDWVINVKALEYLKKPIDLDRLVFAMSIAQGPMLS